jgi:hypothetical protein
MNSPWWSKRWGKDKLCGISHIRLRPGKNKYGTPYVVSLKCSHSFYTNPLCMWIKNCLPDDPTCPLCRKSFVLKDLFQN